MKENRSIEYMVLAFILFAIAIFILFFINGNETHISEEYETEDVPLVYCSTGNLDNAFFKPSLVNTIKNEIKITFKNEKPNQIFYTYNGIYRSNDVAKNDEAVLHAKYNNYFGEQQASPDILSPFFSVVNTKLKITLYAEKTEQINKKTAEFFFIDKDIISEYLSYSKEEMKSYYEEKEFKCIVKD